MSARQNIRSAHTEVEKTRVNGRNLKGAKERNEYLTPADPQSHVLSNALGQHLSAPAAAWTLQSMTSSYFLGIPDNSFSSLLVSVLLVLTAKRFSPEVENLREFTLATVSLSCIMKLQPDLSSRKRQHGGCSFISYLHPSSMFSFGF